MKTVSPNIFMLALRLILLPSLIWTAVFPVYRLLRNDYSNTPTIAFIGIIFFVLFLVFSVMSLMGIFKIKYEISGEVTFYRLYKSCKISIADIDSFYQSVLKTKWKNYPGYFLILKDGTVIELTEHNLSSLRNFYSYLVKSEVPCKGTKNSWYPLKRRFRTT